MFPSIVRFEQVAALFSLAQMAYIWKVYLLLFQAFFFLLTRYSPAFLYEYGEMDGKILVNLPPIFYVHFPPRALRSTSSAGLVRSTLTKPLPLMRQAVCSLAASADYAPVGSSRQTLPDYKPR